MMPWNDLRAGDCCGRLEAVSDGYYCESCDFFVHKECGESSELIEHTSHVGHTLRLHSSVYATNCHLCGMSIKSQCYRCETCFLFNLDLYCARCPPPNVVYLPKTHHHKLTLVKAWIDFDCDANCGKVGDRFPYVCPVCDLTFHVDCVWHPSEVKHPLEVNHSYHSKHPLKLFIGQLPDYSDGKCRLCERKIDDRLFYHCSSCNFSLDMRCVLHPPPKSLLDVKTHEHTLTLLPRLLSFACNACGLNGDRSPYMCVQCDFMIHQDCLGLPRLININRHDHRISRTSVLGVVDSVCGVCRKKVDWTCGGYTCHKCPGYVVHSKCATRLDVWNGKELEGLPEEIEDTEPYVVINDTTIQHFSHKEHYLRLNATCILREENKRCNICTHPISLHSFYGCMDCAFILHKNCAEFLKSRWHVLHNERLTLAPSNASYIVCDACGIIFNGFMYHHEDKKLDVRCGSVSEPFLHPSHPHPLYYVSLDRVNEICNGCNENASPVLKCVEEDCVFVLGFECATLPQVVKHRVDDHPLSLCYGEKATGEYWCDICETKTVPETWFYTCKDRQASLHPKCVLGDFSGLMPGSTINVSSMSYEVVLNSSVTRPICSWCKSHCMSPIILRMLETSETYACSIDCVAQLSDI
ncbi:unnamed protein product [Microthlaspi erraticum]|uniref:Phorbol-ester/DAG-type domain-containing protein n=1 Tax=Microthlaspi erraticum TaxID=1685480 RepID=A0A6D2IBI0_9BRAS|nr:unnamed protein product [Microthlaspi erraticum]